MEVALSCACERLPPLQAAKVASHPWIHFYVDTIVWILFLMFSFSFHFTCGWTRVSSEVDFTDGISTVSPVCHGALQLNQVIPHCETSCWLSCITTHTRTPNAQDGLEGKHARGGDTVQLIQSSFTFQQEKSSTTCKLLLHVVNMLSFSVQQKLSKSLTCTRK